MPLGGNSRMQRIQGVEYGDIPPSLGGSNELVLFGDFQVQIIEYCTQIA